MSHIVFICPHCKTKNIAESKNDLLDPFVDSYNQWYPCKKCDAPKKEEDSKDE